VTDLFQRPFDDLRTGETFITRGRTVTEADVCAFAGLTGDHHPLHTDAVWAAASPFGERVAHGLLVAGAAAGLVPFDPDRVIALRRVRDLVFKHPVRLGETIRVDGAIAQLAPLGDESGLVVCDLRVRTRDGLLACRMTVEVLWRRAEATAEAAIEELESALPDFVPLPI
jgi:acyl dehydratase